ncbi:unnamed protein product [Dovyalis caffra]|uniref:Uncharacterized protein n=1 Tax=Dovyalis caffra TaxID=77055 RepID=A0AAV1R958_9ROSI|nr:unnamed protein product [Dovyalis caffra]
MESECRSTLDNSRTFSIILRLLTHPFRDSLSGSGKIGVNKQDESKRKGGSFKKADRMSATIWNANPKTDILTEGTG